jgi:hypothetical protein
MSDIRPGLIVEFVYYTEYVKENRRVMRSYVYDMDGKQIVLAQSFPVVLRSSVKRNIILTYLEKIEDRDMRFGFSAKIDNLIQYEMSAGDKVQAIIVLPEGPTTPFNLRFHYRLNVPSDSGLSVYFRGERVNLHDISVAGAKISLNGTNHIKPREKIRISLSVGSKEINVEAEILRSWVFNDEKNSKDLQFHAMKFIMLDSNFTQFLGKELFLIERRMVAEGKIWGS